MYWPDEWLTYREAREPSVCPEASCSAVLLKSEPVSQHRLDRQTSLPGSILHGIIMADHHHHARVFPIHNVVRQDLRHTMTCSSSAVILHYYNIKSNGYRTHYTSKSLLLMETCLSIAA